MAQRGWLLVLLASLLAGCSAAFEVGEALNRATSNISSDPARYLWSREPANAEPSSKPAEPERVDNPAASAVPVAIPLRDAK